MPSIEIPTAGVTFHCAEDDTILRAALRAGLGLPYECNVGSCGNCRFLLLDGGVQHEQANLAGWSERDRDQNRWLGCQARPLGDIKIKVPQRESYKSTFPPVRTVGTLVGSTDITHDIREFRFRLEQPSQFRAGQYALIRTPNCDVARAYSMANISNAAADEWHFTIRRVPDGKATSYLFDMMQFGERVAIDGPYGLAYLREDSSRDILCLAGGSGLAPMLSITRAAVVSDQLRGRTVHFLYGGRTPQDICGENMLRLLPGFGARIHYHCTVSDPSPDWDGRTGFVHQTALEIFGEQLKELEIYLAGPPAMADAIMKTAIANRVPVSQLHFDKFY
jgi:toluene monooxygenase electron transfer component